MMEMFMIYMENVKHVFKTAYFLRAHKTFGNSAGEHQQVSVEEWNALGLAVQHKGFARVGQKLMGFKCVK